MNQKFCTQLTEFLGRGERFAILWHQYVDGDAIGSMLAMRQILSDMGKAVDCYTTDNPSAQFDRVTDIDKIQTAIDYNQRYSGLIFLDFTEYSRIPRLIAGHEDRFDSHHKIIIDHHEVVATTPLTTTYIVPQMTSTCELLYEIWSSTDLSVITSTVATHLYLWLTTDTANYLHDGNSTQTLQRGINLIHRGADKKLVQDMILRSYSLGSLQFLGIFLWRLVESDWIYYSYYTDEDLSICGIDKEQACIGTQMLQSIGGSDVVMIFKIKEGMINFSLRSKITPIDHIARHYGWWGHKCASWGARVIIQTWVAIHTQLEHIIHEISQMLVSS